MDLDSPAGNRGDGAFRLARWRSGDAFVELAAAVAVRVAANYFLAGSRTAGALPHSVRRLGLPRRSTLQYSPENARPLGRDDARGTREVPRGDGRALGRIRRLNRGKQGAMKLTLPNYG